MLHTKMNLSDFTHFIFFSSVMILGKNTHVKSENWWLLMRMMIIAMIMIMMMISYLYLYSPDLTSCHVSMTRSSSQETKCSRCKKNSNKGIYPSNWASNQEPFPSRLMSKQTLPKAQRTRGLSSSCQSQIASSNTNLDRISSSESWLSIN